MKKTVISLLLATHLFAVSVYALPAQVLIIRHGEKGIEGNLSEKGLERAGALAPYFTKKPELLTFGEPVAIFAARPVRATPPFHPDENTERCLQTVGPTAEMLKLPIHPGFGKFDEQELANFILSNSKYDGKNVLICWHHDVIQQLAIDLGAMAAPVFPDVFDQTWVITYPGASLVILQQELLFGDTP